MSGRKRAENMGENGEDGKNQGGRPTKFKKEYIQQAFALALHGAEYKELPELLGINPKTLKSWEKTHPEVLIHFSRGKKLAPSDVSLNLYRRACGYSHKAVKIFCLKNGLVVKVPYTEHYPPDPKAAELFLTNRDPKRWKKRLDVKHELADGLAARLAAARQRVTKKGGNG